jgi:hypothetical protein
MGNETTAEILLAIVFLPPQCLKDEKHMLMTDTPILSHSAPFFLLLRLSLSSLFMRSSYPIMHPSQDAPAAPSHYYPTHSKTAVPSAAHLEDPATTAG